MAGKKENIAPMWASFSKFLQLDPLPTFMVVPTWVKFRRMCNYLPYSYNSAEIDGQSCSRTTVVEYMTLKPFRKLKSTVLLQRRREFKMRKL